MSLSVYINFKQPTRHNYFLSHPYIYDGLSDADMANYDIDEYWEANITHNLGEMASQVPLGDISLYDVCWRPEEVFNEPTTNDLVPLLTAGITYMLANRKQLSQYNPKNGWGSYDALMKFLLNYKQACEDYPDCKIEVSR